MTISGFWSRYKDVRALRNDLTISSFEMRKLARVSKLVASSATLEVYLSANFWSVETLGVEALEVPGVKNLIGHKPNCFGDTVTQILVTDAAHQAGIQDP